jgi:hypothetical protein
MSGLFYFRKIRIFLDSGCRSIFFRGWLRVPPFPLLLCRFCSTAPGSGFASTFVVRCRRDSFPGETGGRPVLSRFAAACSLRQPQGIARIA